MRPVTYERIREVLDYDPETGILVWKVSPDRRPQWIGEFAGKVAGYLNRAGYITVSIDDHPQLAHRMIWLWMTGALPKVTIDHSNGIRSDNRWCNIREATRSENSHNGRLPLDNTSGYVGVSFHKSYGKYRAQIMAKGKRYWLGAFDTPEEAYAAYLAAKTKLHPFQPIPRYEVAQ